MLDQTNWLKLLSNEYTRAIVENVYKEIKEKNMMQEKQMITLMEIPCESWR